MTTRNPVCDWRSAAFVVGVTLGACVVVVVAALVALALRGGAR